MKPIRPRASSDVTGGAGAWHQKQMKEAMNRDDVRSELFGSQNEAARVGYWELLYDLARARPVISINSRWTCTDIGSRRRTTWGVPGTTFQPRRLLTL